MKENKTEIVKIQLDDGSEAYAELKREGFVEMGFTEKSYKVSSDYINIASNIINNLKSIDLKPEEIELEFGVKLEMVGGKLLSWIATDIGAEASISVKAKWEMK